MTKDKSPGPMDLPPDHTSRREEAAQIEKHWRDETKEPATFSLPPWHQSVLQERVRLVAEGKLKFQDWETMFRELRDELPRESES